MYILFDIGGTKTRVAASADLVTYNKPLKFDTPLNYNEGLQTLSNAIKNVSGGAKITALAGGIRGPLNHKKTGIISEVKLTDWVGKLLAVDLQAEFGVQVHLENDTAIVGLGEAIFGAGKEYLIVAYHTVSTGVGGARIVDKKIDKSSIGFEPGHQILDIDRSIINKDTPHTLENLVSGTALEKRFGKKPYDIDQSDPVWDELARYLAFGLKNTIMYWSPDIIVLGGSMVIGDPRILNKDIVRHVKELLGDLEPCPPIVDAKLRDEGGLYGAMALCSQNK